MLSVAWRSSTLSALLSIASSSTAGSREWQLALRGVAYRGTKRCFLSTLFRFGYDPRDDPAAVLLQTLSLRQPLATTAMSCKHASKLKAHTRGTTLPYLQRKRFLKRMLWMHHAGAREHSCLRHSQRKSALRAAVGQQQARSPCKQKFQSPSTWGRLPLMAPSICL